MAKFVNSSLILGAFVLVFTGCQMAPCRTTKASEQSIPQLKSDLTKSPSKMVFVYKDNGEKQCGEGRPPISLDEMAKSLKGIKILSQSIKNDGMMRPSMCGASTGAINVYEINPADLKKALDLGFNQYKPE